MRLWIFSLCLLWGNSNFCQSFQAYQKAANKAFEQKDYYATLHYCRGALERKPQSMEVWYLYGQAAQLFYAYEEAVKAYQKVLRLDKEKQFPELMYQLALVYKGKGEYVEALASFQEYLPQASAALREEVDQHIQACQEALVAKPDETDYVIEALSKRLNSPYSDFGAWKQGDTLYYSSYKFENKQDKAKPKRKIAKLLFAKGNGRGRPLRNLNSDTSHIAHTAISLDGKRLYYTQCRDGAKGDIQCALYYRKKERRNRWGRKAYKLPTTINVPNFTTTQPAIGYDSLLQQEVLYYVSDRTGGVGGLDIWWVKIEPGENSFSAPIAFSQNTPQDEITPFLSTREQVLYFSGRYARGLGGFDIYQYPLQAEERMAIRALSRPLNSSYNDIYYMQEAKSGRGYFSSNRPGQRYLDPLSKACCNDLYQFVAVEKTKTTTPADSLYMDSQPSLSPLPRPETKVDQASEELDFTPVPTSLADFLPLALYFENDQPDPRTRRGKTKLDYLSTYEPYLEAEEVYLDNYLALFPSEQKGRAREEMQAFFEKEVSFGGERLILFSHLLLQRLEDGDHVEIFVKGFTSPRAQSDYNLQLGKRRVSSLINHFQSFQDGILQPYLQGKQLVISERSFGETTADQDVSDDLTDRQRSIYSINAARERRVEIVEVKRN